MSSSSSWRDDGDQCNFPTDREGLMTWLLTVGTNWEAVDADFCSTCETPGSVETPPMPRCPVCGCSWTGNATRAMSNWVKLTVGLRWRDQQQQEDVRPKLSVGSSAAPELEPEATWGR